MRCVWRRKKKSNNKKMMKMKVSNNNINNNWILHYIAFCGVGGPKVIKLDLLNSAKTHFKNSRWCL